jgi:hypothetical protein
MIKKIILISISIYIYIYIDIYMKNIAWCEKEKVETSNIVVQELHTKGFA